MHEQSYRRRALGDDDECTEAQRAAAAAARRARLARIRRRPPVCIVIAPENRACTVPVDTVLLDSKTYWTVRKIGCNFSSVDLSMVKPYTNGNTSTSTRFSSTGTAAGTTVLVQLYRTGTVVPSTMI